MIESTTSASPTLLILALSIHSIPHLPIFSPMPVHYIDPFHLWLPCNTCCLSHALTHFLYSHPLSFLLCFKIIKEYVSPLHPSTVYSLCYHTYTKTMKHICITPTVSHTLFVSAVMFLIAVVLHSISISVIHMTELEGKCYFLYPGALTFPFHN